VYGLVYAAGEPGAASIYSHSIPQQKTYRLNSISAPEEV
jgi:hypothetical protein